MSDLLKQYNELQLQLMDINAQLADITAAIRAEVDEQGMVAGHGVKAYYKPGRRSTDHEAAVKETPPTDDILALIEKHSTTKTTTAWAKVTKEAGIDVTTFTTEGEPTFVIEVL